MLNRAIAPATKPFSNLEIPQQTVSHPAWGVTLHVINRGELPAVRISVIWHAGAAMPALRMAAGFVPALMQEGTASHSGAEIADIIDFNGAFLSTRAGAHYTGFTLMALNDSVAKLLPLIVEMIRHPSMPADVLETMKHKNMVALNIRRAKVSTKANEELRRLLTADSHPYLKIDTPDDIEAVTLRQVIDAHCTGTRHTDFHVFVAGKVSDSMLAGVHELCRALAPEDTSAIVTPVVMTPAPPQEVSVHVPDARQAAVACAIPTINRDHADYTELRHVVVALGGYFGSRLMTNIREDKGLTYGISAALNGAAEGAYMTINAQCSPQYTPQVIDEIRHELCILGSEPMGTDELSRLKHELTSRLAQTLETPFSILEYYENQVIVNTPANYFDDQFRTINALTPERICELASRHLNPQHLRIAYTS